MVRQRLNSRIFSISGYEGRWDGANGWGLGYAVGCEGFGFGVVSFSSRVCELAACRLKARSTIRRGCCSALWTSMSRRRRRRLDSLTRSLATRRTSTKRARRPLITRSSLKSRTLLTSNIRDLLEVNGKPLKGQALEDEQRRYESAVRERSALDGFARAKIEHSRLLDAGIKLRDLLTEYRISGTESVTMDDCKCILFDLVPDSDAAKKHYRLWIDPGTSEIRRLDFEQLAYEGQFLSGGTGTETFQYLDGIPLVVHSHFDGRALLNNETVRVVADHSYSRFRKFSVTTTIIPVTPSEKQ